MSNSPTSQATCPGEQAIVHHKKGHLEQAISHYEQALSIDSQQAKIHSNLGVPLCENRQFEQTIGCHFQVL